jgi:hypothetical protein
VSGHVGKGVYVKKAATLLQAWASQCGLAKYAAEVRDRVPDIHLPFFKVASRTGRIYTVDGFVEETGELTSALLV